MFIMIFLSSLFSIQIVASKLCKLLSRSLSFSVF
uniref:Uncharacterized protein n=1 Tax=Rhizophora mucronata TaxID=61149 RepID=A0A2P2N475_RHIMU